MYTLKKEMPELKKPEGLPSLVKRLGTPESTLLLQSPSHVFQIPQVDGAIGYYKIGNCAIVIGDPICLPKDFAELTHAFHLHCQEKELKTVYFLVHCDFAHWAIAHGCRTLIQVCSELSINPTSFREKQKLRWKINQSVQQGVLIKEYRNFEPSLENRIKKAIETWSKERSGPQIYLGKIDFFHSNPEKRVFYAKLKDKIIGVLVLSPLDRFNGWVVSFHLALKSAPIGTTEHLMTSVVNSLASENCRFLCLGVIAGTKLGEMVGLGPFGKTIASFIFRVARWLFKLDKKAIYLNKYHPDLLSTYFLCKDNLTITELLAIKKLLNVKL